MTSNVIQSPGPAGGRYLPTDRQSIESFVISHEATTSLDRVVHGPERVQTPFRYIIVMRILTAFGSLGVVSGAKGGPSPELNISRRPLQSHHSCPLYTRVIDHNSTRYVLRYSQYHVTDQTHHESALHAINSTIIAR